MNARKRIESRKLGREQATVLRDLIEFPDGVNPMEFSEALLKRIADLLPKRPEPEQVIESFQRLGSLELEFGRFSGMSLAQIDETEPEYLDWLCGKTEAFLPTLQAYLKHPARLH